jgi:hypothetical protein
MLAAASQDPTAAKPLLEEACVQFRALGDALRESWCLHDLSVAAGSTGDLDAAERHLMASLALKRTAAEPWDVATTLSGLGVLAVERGDLSSATAHMEEALLLLPPGSDAWGIRGLVTTNLAEVRLRSGHAVVASAELREGLRLHAATRSWYMIAMSLWLLAAAMLDLGKPRRAAHRLGAAHSILSDVGLSPGSPDNVAQYEAAHRRCLVALGSAEFERLSAAGAAMTREDAIAYGLSTDDTVEDVDA